MAITQYFDPFTKMQEGANVDSQIQSRNAKTQMDLYAIQTMMDEKKARMAYLQETQNPQPKGPPGTPQQANPSASDMILNEVNDLDRKIAAAGKYGLLPEQDRLTKQRESTMGRYSLALSREDTARDKQQKELKEKTASVSRFASGANAVLMDDSIPSGEKQQALRDLEDSIRSENPGAYKILAQGQPQIDWTDKRTWNRMKVLEAQAIDPAKRVEMTLAQQKADEQSRRDDIRERQVDAMIANMRERGDRDGAKLPTGTEWVDPKDHSKGAQKIKILGDEKVLNSAQKELNADALYKNYDRYKQAYDVTRPIAAKVQAGIQPSAADVQQLREHYQNIISDYRARQGGKYNQQEFARLNGTYQNIEKWLQTIGTGTPAASKDVAAQVIGTVANEYVNRTKEVVLQGLRTAANVEKRGGNANDLRLKGDVNVLIQNGMASVKEDDEGNKWIGIKDGAETRKFKLPEGAF